MTSPSTPFCDSETLLSHYSLTDLIRWRSIGHPDYDWCLRTKMTEQLWHIKELNVRRHNLLIEIRNHGKHMKEMTYGDGIIPHLKMMNRASLNAYKRKIDRHNYTIATRRPESAITRGLFDQLEHLYLTKFTWTVENFDLNASIISDLGDAMRKMNKVRGLKSRKYSWKWIDFSDVDDPDIHSIIEDILGWANINYEEKFAECNNNDVVFVSKNSRTKLTKFFE